MITIITVNVIIFMTCIIAFVYYEVKRKTPKNTFIFVSILVTAALAFVLALADTNTQLTLNRPVTTDYGVVRQVTDSSLIINGSDYKHNGNTNTPCRIKYKNFQAGDVVRFVHTNTFLADHLIEVEKVASITIEK